MTQNLENPKIYNDNSYLNIEAIQLYFALALPLTVFFLPQSESGFEKKIILFFVMCLISLVLFLAFSFELNYFVLSKNHLIIKNPIWFWKEKSFSVESIKEIEFESEFRSGICLKVNFNNNSKSFASKSLKDKSWKRLKEDLQSRGIIVNDKANLGIK
ncbi:hypothetical protein FEDK69T_31330 [Flavobacterium enshiense DK69]|uniref:Uncharacterized protein n=1 Tax=Flavobacterium enshiense DK69 TaxID=1107311 RepID=V6RZ68_9FLAO|nr:hypothetical protein [Flavobacterium enshiense]ESU19464.1 hypothetical protein FEDK69T_31330 [Flavobacterium enshiense DK69]KGO92831.1 hypothetical protein Q767_15435 [Flavobacterium enshiense DK69]